MSAALRVSVGTMFGRLTLREIREGQVGVFSCECGGAWAGGIRYVVRGNTRSCGCLRHGLSFWDRVVRSDGCWEWQGACYRSGYGAAQYNGRPAKAHRVAWELTNGPISGGLLVLHSCDNRRCVNPTHLFLGTHQDNMDDMKAKGRQAVGDRHGSRLHPETLQHGDRNWTRRHPERLPRGEQNHAHKLTETQVREMRGRHARGETMRSLSRAFGVSRPVVRGIVRLEQWRHVL